MALDFPNTPTVGQVFVGPNNQMWTWDGTKWTPSAGSAVSEAPSNGHLYVRQSGAWVRLDTTAQWVGP